MTIDMWNQFKNNGFVFGSYTFLRCLDTITALVLCQIIAEYNHANNKKLNTDSLFLSDLNRMSDYLGLDMKDLKISLDELSYLGFISVWNSGIENTKLIYVSEKNIIKYKEQEEQKTFGMIGIGDLQEHKTLLIEVQILSNQH